MSITDLLFRPEAAAVASGIVAAVVVGKSLVKLQDASKEMGKKLRKLDRRIAKNEEGLPEKRERIKDLDVRMSPLKAKLRNLNLYLDKLTEIAHASERREVRQEKKEEEAKPRGSVIAPDSGRRPAG